MADQDNISLAIVGITAVVALLVLFLGAPTGALNVYGARIFHEDAALIEGEVGTEGTEPDGGDLGHLYYTSVEYKHLPYARDTLLMEYEWAKKFCEELYGGFNSNCYWRQGAGNALSGTFYMKPIEERAGKAAYHREKKAEWA